VGWRGREDVLANDSVRSMRSRDFEDARALQESPHCHAGYKRTTGLDQNGDVAHHVRSQHLQVFFHSEPLVARSGTFWRTETVRASAGEHRTQGLRATECMFHSGLAGLLTVRTWIRDCATQHGIRASKEETGRSSDIICQVRQGGAVLGTENMMFAPELSR